MVCGEKINDFGLALITPLGTYYDGDWHETLLLTGRNRTLVPRERFATSFV